jgi:hypothetical protein
MKSKRIIITILVFIVTAFELPAQIDKNGGSVYSIFGIGDLNYSTSLRTDAMGIMGISLFGNYTNVLNPAAWTKIPSTRFTTVFKLESVKSTDGTNDAERTYGNFGGFNLSIPANINNGWIIDAGISPYSVVNYDIKITGASGDEGYTQYYSGNGGLTRITLGTSYLLFKYFSFGIQFNYAFGNITKSTIIDFNNSSLTDTRNKISNSLSGFYFNTGLIFHGFGKVFKSKRLDDLNIGAFFSIPYKLNSSRVGRFQTSVQTDSVNLSEGKLDIPWAGGLGFSYIFSKKLTVAADIFMQNWDNYKYYDVHPAEIKNNIRIGAGLEYVPSKKLDAAFYERTAYRIGGNFTSDYLKLNGKSVNVLGVSAGLSLPISSYNTFDILLSYTTRGTTSDGLIKDDVLKVGASVNIGELWFLKPKEE